MMQSVIIKPGPFGRRAHKIDDAEAEKLVTRGVARKLRNRLFEIVYDDDDDDIPVAPIVESAYETKVMHAETPKRRGRPRKVEQ